MAQSAAAVNAGQVSADARASVADPADCPLGLAINTIGGRWKLHILRALMLQGSSRYNALAQAIDGVSAKELTRKPA